MKITHFHLSNFKRFSDLTLDGIPDTSKLVLLIGSNGSGKSSVFDAFESLNSSHKNDVKSWDYYKKKEQQDVSVKIRTAAGAEYMAGNVFVKNPPLSPFSFYGRTSFRQIPRLTRTALGQGQFDFEKDSDRPKYFIDRDNRFENDIEKITEIILNEIFKQNTSNEQVKSKFIEPINSALERIFGGKNGTKLSLVKIIPPLEGKIAQVVFQKGESEIHYNFLSAGEKEVFNLLINLLSRSTLYQDTVYFLDEMDLHLNTRIQFNLLKEITENWIPDNCQLWTASHSLGFIEYAKQSETASILDFDDLDFDLPKTISPEPKDNPDIYEIAVGKEFLPSLFRQMKVYFVENKDRGYYASVGIDNAVFVSDNNRNNVYHKVRATNFQGIVDRDFLSDAEILMIKKNYPNLHILRYYSIENYFYHPENLAEYHQNTGVSFDKKLYINQLTEAKNLEKDSIIPHLSLKRTEYPYFGEPEWNGKPEQNHFKNKKENEVESAVLAKYLNSDDFETFYKVLPMKTYCTHLAQRQNIPKNELAKTNWFRSELKGMLK